MSSSRIASKKSWPVIAGVVGLSAVAVAVTFFSRPRTTTPSAANTGDPSTVTITTDDGIALAATVKYPARTDPAPVVVLLHQYGQDRHQWDPYLERFLQAGFVVMSYDLRGFGDSRLPEIPTDQAEHLRSLINDLPAVMRYLQQDVRVDPQRLNLVGASIGANTAFVFNGTSALPRRTVLLSPVAVDGVERGFSRPEFRPQNIFGLASDTEAKDLRTFLQAVTGEKKEQVVARGGHGVELLERDGVMDQVITWLQK